MRRSSSAMRSRAFPSRRAYSAASGRNGDRGDAIRGAEHSSTRILSDAAQREQQPDALYTDRDGLVGHN